MHRVARKLKPALLVGALVTAAVLSGGSSASATNTTNQCAWAVMIGVRGTSAPGGAGSTQAGHGWTSGGMGDVVGQFMATYLLPSDPWNEYGLYVESLNYPASDAGGYAQSVTAGVQALQAELEWMASHCASPPAVVLAGHSQGAQVILTALAPGSEIKFGGGFYPTLSAKARSMVRAVVVWGDPTWKPGQAWNSPDSVTAGQGILARGQASSDYLSSEYRSWGWPQGSTSPNPQWVPKIRSYCYARDWACQAGSPIDNQIHSSYKSYMSDPRSFVQFMMTDFS